MIEETEEKRALLNRSLPYGPVRISVDGRQFGVDVPASLRKEDLTLVLSAPELNDWGITEKLSFSGYRCPVRVPWFAVVAMTCEAMGHVKVWAPPPAPPTYSKRIGALGLLR